MQSLQQLEHAIKHFETMLRLCNQQRLQGAEAAYKQMLNQAITDRATLLTEQMLKTYGK